MCQKGVNPDQVRLMIGQADDTIAMAQQWLEQIHHLADHADLAEASAHVAQASVLLGEARAKLDDAGSEVESTGESEGASVELV